MTELEKDDQTREIGVVEYSSIFKLEYSCCYKFIVLDGKDLEFLLWRLDNLGAISITVEPKTTLHISPQTYQ